MVAKRELLLLGGILLLFGGLTVGGAGTTYVGPGLLVALGGAVLLIVALTLREPIEDELGEMISDYHRETYLGLHKPIGR